MPSDVLNSEASLYPLGEIRVKPTSRPAPAITWNRREWMKLYYNLTQSVPMRISSVIDRHYGQTEIHHVYTHMSSLPIIL
jgi:hypothetical protein